MIPPAAVRCKPMSDPVIDPLPRAVQAISSPRDVHDGPEPTRLPNEAEDTTAVRPVAQAIRGGHTATKVSSRVNETLSSNGSLSSWPEESRYRVRRRSEVPRIGHFETTADRAGGWR
jgi:hypothetical protein